ncbi:MAG: glucoamylase family protein [Saprospiraceae bacterium]
MKMIYSLLLFTLFFSCNKDVDNTELIVENYSINESNSKSLKGCDLNPVIKIDFSTKIDAQSAQDIPKVYGGNGLIDIDISLENDDSTIVIKPINNLNYLTYHLLYIDTFLKAQNGNYLNSKFKSNFTTKLDSTDKYSQISDDELLELIQRQTFKYFWDFSHPDSGLARERNTSGDIVTSGGSGFGIMSIIVGVDRGFISREEGLNRLLKITDFLKNKADRFHGAFSHWLNGSTGKVVPFSTKDDGGDIVETSYLLAGLLSARQYFDGSSDNEVNLRNMINNIWNSVEWNWYTKNDEKVLYWHWSPDYEWAMNHQLKGWNEALITYILAASSPDYAIDKDVYDQGWASNGSIKNGNTFYGYTLPLGSDYGGPLFFEQYTFLGIDPHELSDNYADYWTQVVNHSLINYEYCKANPKNYYGYSDICWGLTASDSNDGYSAHSPTNDLGVITPTAALSSMAFSPEESMAALRFFYYTLGDKLFKEYGFIDAFNLNELWFANSFLAIDQGPIIVMIENYRSGLIWNLLMNDPDVKAGMQKLEFHSGKYGF